MSKQNHQLSLIEPEQKTDDPVTCLGMTFENDAARRTHFTELLRQKLQDPEFRQIEGFPIGEDEDILALSDPPYYTACPNPWLADFVAEWEAQKTPKPEGYQYKKEPFAVDVSHGKTDQLYKAHSYHTKVPHLAIVPSILHYTEPGDIVLDAFCGSGMTGVAAQWCGTAPASYRQELELTWQAEGLGIPQWGTRNVILNDLSPAATFIAANYNLPFDVEAFSQAGRQLLDEVEQELGWMYETHHTNGEIGRIEYTVWSEIFICPNCAGEFTFSEEALDNKTKRVKSSFPCSLCGNELNKRKADRAYYTRYDSVLQQSVRVPKRAPFLIVYQYDDSRYEKEPDANDLNLIERIEKLGWPNDMPIDELPYMHMTHERARMDYVGITHVHQFFLIRAAHSLTTMWNKVNNWPDKRLQHMLLYFVEQAIWGMSVLNRYQPIQHGQIGGSQVNRQLSGVYYVSSQISEVSPTYNLSNKLGRLINAFSTNFSDSGNSVITTGTATRITSIPSKVVDYVFTDPPFGENIYYADLNFLVEAWHRVFTNAKPEAIVDRAKRKTLGDYERLMQSCFIEYYRILKPGRWMTVVFHNSHNAVWTAIQNTMATAGFVIADVRTLDKQQGSYRQVTSSAMKQDLVVSAYKPGQTFTERFQLAKGSPESAWEFVRTHLAQVPIFMERNGKVESVRERMADLLYDRMVAYHVLNDVSVPLSAAEFRKGLMERFAERDDMFFLPEQVVEYDKKRLTVRELIQLQIFVTDESSAITWIRQQLTRKPQTSQDLQPQFMQETKGGWQQHEKSLELRDLLHQNFLEYDGVGDVPSQIHSYLSTNYKDLRNLPKNDLTLRTQAKGRWYVPDINKQADLEKLRERALLREFETYKQDKQRKLKEFRLEAVRAGFKQAWQDRDYVTIIIIAEKIPDIALREDPKLLMWYDMSLTRTGNES